MLRVILRVFGGGGTVYGRGVKATPSRAQCRYVVYSYFFGEKQPRAVHNVCKYAQIILAVKCAGVLLKRFLRKAVFSVHVRVCVTRGVLSLYPHYVISVAWASLHMYALKLFPTSIEQEIELQWHPIYWR